MCKLCDCTNSNTVFDVSTFVRENIRYDGLICEYDAVHEHTLMVITCKQFEKLPSIKAPGMIEIKIKNCDKLKEIVSLHKDGNLTIIDCDNLTYVKDLFLFLVNIINCKSLINISDIDRCFYLTIKNCEKLESLIDIKKVYILKIQNCLQINKLENIINVDIFKVDILQYDKITLTNLDEKMIETINKHKAVLSFIKKQIPMIKFLRLCKSEKFNRYFWNPKNMGGKWHINKMTREFSKL